MLRRARLDDVEKLTVVLAVLLLALTTGCRPRNPAAVVDPMTKFYLDNGWIPLPMPDSRFAPGVIFSYDKATGIRYVSSLKTCGMPEDVFSAVTGTSGKLAFTYDSSYSADAVLQIKGVKAGPEWSKVKKTTLALDVHGGSSLDLINVKAWVADPANAPIFTQRCDADLKQPNVYIVQEAYLVKKGKYTLHDEHGASIAVKGLELGPVKFEPNASAKATADGSLEFDEPLYTAVRRVRRINGGFESLGKATQEHDADSEIIQSMKTR